MKKLNNLQHLIGCCKLLSKVSEIKIENITKYDITLQHIAEMSLCCEVISFFVIGPICCSSSATLLPSSLYDVVNCYVFL